MKIKFPPYPVCDPEIHDAVSRQLASGQWVRLEGAPELEAAWEAYQGQGHAWFLSSGTAALEAIFLGHGIGPGDEIVTTPYTWGASVAAILAIGAIPVFADVDFETGQIDPASAEAAISPRTRAILAVHFFGIPSPMVELVEIAKRHGLLLFEDASQAHGAEISGRKVGNFGDASAFSCMGLKPFGATEGGIALFKSEEARERAYLYGRHPRGIDPDRVARLQEAGLLDTLQLGWRPSPLSAAILMARLPRLDRENAARRNNARHLRDQLDGLEAARLTAEPAGADAIFHLLSLIVDPEKSHLSLEEAQEALREQNIPAFRYIPVPVHRMKRLNPAGYEGPPVLWHHWLRQAGVDYREISCPNAEKRCRCTLEVSWNFTTTDKPMMEAIGNAIRDVFA